MIDFSASQTKIRRAEKFIAELEDILQRYHDSKPYTATVLPEDPSNVRVDFAVVPGDPEAVIGDCIHNLRAALDLMACDLVRAAGGNDRHVYFPFARREADLEKMIKEKNFDRAGVDAVTLLKSFKPYRSGDELLRAMHDLDIEDKHKALIITGTSRDITIEFVYEIDNPAGGNFLVIPRNIYFLFPDDSPLGGKNVIETLKDLRNLVCKMLDDFARAGADLTPLAGVGQLRNPKPSFSRTTRRARRPPSDPAPCIGR